MLSSSFPRQVVYEVRCMTNLFCVLSSLKGAEIMRIDKSWINLFSLSCNGCVNGVEEFEYAFQLRYEDCNNRYRRTWVEVETHFSKGRVIVMRMMKIVVMMNKMKAKKILGQISRFDSGIGVNIKSTDVYDIEIVVSDIKRIARRKMRNLRSIWRKWKIQGSPRKKMTGKKNLSSGRPKASYDRKYFEIYKHDKGSCETPNTKVHFLIYSIAIFL